MPKIEKTQTGVQECGEPEMCLLAHNEELAATVSAYLDGELAGQALADFEALLHENEALSREVAEMGRINRRLAEIGADILTEPVPESLLVPLSRLPVKSDTGSG
jgi:anti-sigma factor RsiW